ncbi:MAG: NAD(P)-dependent dehydrogenase (short-subunit alcohol dehydrogenase family) [Candidatus Aldehydirespiratoraceae bacterium]|jgi:NAD(P)-dependent dehydrogenase (short-subunit alcohol dehydrogenase family)|tara:strand:+ start:24259 stop:25023 length:765 start_codon:yes stop_codon:yes gene_type:complete
MSMTKRTILITGAGSGFGKGAAIELARRGHTVIAATETQAQADALAAEQPALATLKLDVTSTHDISAVPALGVDVLINNAGLGVMAPMATVPMERVRAAFDVNVFGMVEMSQAVIPGMQERGWGRIINVSSVAGVFASPLGSPYSMTKHAVEAFTKSLRDEMAPYGVDVTKVNPGPYNTGFNDRMVQNIDGFTAADDASSKAIAGMLADAVLPNQLDPMDVVMALADLSEAEETPVETMLPPSVLDDLLAMLES